MTGGYAIMPFRVRCRNQAQLSFYQINGERANKKMAGGGNQKRYVASALGKQYYLYSHIARNTHQNNFTNYKVYNFKLNKFEKVQRDGGGGR